MPEPLREAPACPYTIRAGERQSVLDPKASGTVEVSFVPCLGARCMAYATVREADGKLHATCSRLMATKLLDNLVGSVGSLAGIIEAALEAQGIKRVPVAPPSSS